MSYREVIKFLDRHTDVVELASDDGARVAVCPEWQGRVMTSSCGAGDGQSFGFVNRRYQSINALFVKIGLHDSSQFAFELIVFPSSILSKN